jgi:hypothetical protein
MVKLRVALAQTCPINAEVRFDNTSDPFQTIERNLLDVKERVKTASGEGADVVVFPEYFLQGLVDQGRQVSLLPATWKIQADIAVPMLLIATSGYLPKSSGTRVQHIHRWHHRPCRYSRHTRQVAFRSPLHLSRARDRSMVRLCPGPSSHQPFTQITECRILHRGKYRKCNRRIRQA